MVSVLLIVVLSLLLLIEFVIICLQRLEIFEGRHELHEIRRWQQGRDRSFWGTH